MPAGGSCLLSAINLSEFVNDPLTNNAQFNFDEFIQVVKDATIYMNEVLEEGLPLHPLQEQRDSVRDWRQIGIGIMSLADMFIKMNIRYGSKESLELINKIGYTMINASLQQSALLAKEYGVYPKFNKNAILNSDFFKSNANDETIKLVEKYGLRNSQLLTIAPNGSISTMFNVSGGIEPFFMLSYYRTTESLHNEKKTYKVYASIVEEYMKINNIQNEEDLPDIFVTAMTLNYKDRIDMQATWQKYIDASISSTVNVPEEFTVEQVEDLYMYAWKSGLKGVTLFRNNCKRAGILSGENNNEKQQETIQSTQLKQNEHKVTIEKRPKRLYGFTEKVNVPVGNRMGKAYITINVDENNYPYEVFVNANDTEIKSLAEKLGRLTTQFLRYGGTENNLEQVVKHLKKSEPMTSLSFIVASLLERVAYGKIESFKQPTTEKIVSSNPVNTLKLAECPECHTNKYDKGNCICLNCGYSSCS